MATQQTRTLGRVLIAPAVVLLFVWMIVPLAMTIYFSLQYKNLLNPGEESFAGLDNFTYFLTDPAFVTALVNTLILVGSVLLITIVLGIFVALLMNMPIYGRNIVRLMVIAPFFVMPTVSALVWKNLLMHPVSGLFAKSRHRDLDRRNGFTRRIERHDWRFKMRRLDNGRLSVGGRLLDRD